MHPATPNRRMARAIIFKDNAILLIRRHNSQGKYYTLPGGGIEMNETEAEAAAREVLEEASISAQVGRLVYEDASPQFGHTYYFLADYVSGEPAVQADADEARLNKKGKDTYEPLWLHKTELAKINLLPEGLKLELLVALDQGFPEKPKILALSA